MARSTGQTQVHTQTQTARGADAPQTESMRHARKAFEQVGKVSKKVATPMRPFLDRVFDRVLPTLPTAQELDWGDEADWARLQQEPLRARFLLRMIALVVLLLLVWAGFTEIDEVTRGEGKVIPSSQVQIIQAVDAGMVEELRVHEGQIVQKNEMLLRIGTTRFTAERDAVRAELLSLQAKEARLLALIDGRPLMMPPEVLKEVPKIAAQEEELYNTSKTGAEAQISIVKQQLHQREEELGESQAFLQQSIHNLKLAKEEWEKLKELVKTGAVSPMEVLRQEQAVTKLDGDVNQTQAKISRVQSAIIEARNKISEVEITINNQWRKERSEAVARIEGLTATIVTSGDKIKQADVRSPVRGTVKRLLVNTVGAVVLPGKELVEVVPLDDELLLEAQVKPKDIAFLRPDLPAKVKITAYDFAIYGGLDGKVEQISPDTVTDERGNVFYIIKVRTQKSSLGDNMPISPGMVAQVDVLTGKKSVLSYLLKPVLRAKANAMTER
ncbi:MAG: HlyD family type I secretion periplasmic adaptor subunit [Azoarcus sp.]|nr:HlyD family type I secretion periplasmic adaptor subunit [Azoarcus sp.]